MQSSPSNNLSTYLAVGFRENEAVILFMLSVSLIAAIAALFIVHYQNR